MIKVSINVPASIFLRNVDGKPVHLDVAKLPASIVGKVFEAGAKVILTNAYNGGGAKSSDVEKLAQMQKRMDAWVKGEYAVTERGASQETIMREVYVARVMDAKGCSAADVDKAIKATVAKVMGKDTAAKFSTFISCVAKVKFPTDADGAAKWEQDTITDLEQAAAILAAERSKATESIDLSDFDF